MRQEAPPTSSPHRGGGDGVRLANTTVMATEHKRNPKKCKATMKTLKTVILHCAYFNIQIIILVPVVRAIALLEFQKEVW